MDFVYADMMYDDLDFSWLDHVNSIMKDNAVVAVQTDYRSVAQLKLYMDELFGQDNFINWVIWSYNWGGRPKNAFGRKHDDILIYSKGADYKFYGNRIGIPKATAGTGFDKSGRDWQIPTDVWEGNFSTMSKERIKFNGKGFVWQKPMWLLERLILAFTDEDDIVFDPFLGSGSTGHVCINLKRNFYGCEILEDVFELASQRLAGANNEFK